MVLLQALLDGRAMAPDSPDRAAVAAVVAELLTLADAYYRSARQGMRAIPLASRAAIVVAPVAKVSPAATTSPPGSTLTCSQPVVVPAANAAQFARVPKTVLQAGEDAGDIADATQRFTDAGGGAGVLKEFANGVLTLGDRGEVGRGFG
mgnify:CR=1 FL=1